MAATMRSNNDRAPVVELEFSKTPAVSSVTYIMKPSPIKEKPSALRVYTSNCIALDRLVEVALSPTGMLDSSFRNNARTPETSKIYPKSAGSRDGSRDGEGENGDSAAKRRYCCSNGIKLSQLPAAPSPSSPSPSPSSEAPNHQSAGYFQQQQQQQQQKLKLKRRLSSFNEISTPAGRSSSSLRVHVEHPHAKRFKLTPRFKALVDISC